MIVVTVRVPVNRMELAALYRDAVGEVKSEFARRTRRACKRGADLPFTDHYTIKLMVEGQVGRAGIRSVACGPMSGWKNEEECAWYLRQVEAAYTIETEYRVDTPAVPQGN